MPRINIFKQTIFPWILAPFLSYWNPNLLSQPGAGAEVWKGLLIYFQVESLKMDIEDINYEFERDRSEYLSSIRKQEQEIAFLQVGSC